MPRDMSDFQFANQDSIVNYWLTLGAPASKLNLGVQFHGRSFTLANKLSIKSGSPIAGPGTAGPFTNSPFTLSYPEVC
jgi:chitinase